MKHARGASMVEFLIVGPMLILIGLGVVQTGLVFQAKSALNFALQQSARVGAVNFGDVAAIERGLQDGLVPYMGGGNSVGEVATTRARVVAEFTRGAAAGWIRVRQISPTPASFSDWAEDAYDEAGNAIREIPNANLAIMRCTKQPNGAAAGARASSSCQGGGEPIGADSQQTLSDANLLKLELTYGVKLAVPLVNRIVGGALSMAAGCRQATNQRLGPVNLDAPVVDPQPDKCAYYNARALDGTPEPRIPVNLSVTVRMQSPARFAGNAGWFARPNRGRDANTTGPQLGNGDVYAASQFAPIPVAQLNPNGVTLANDQFDNTGNGATYFGADTNWERLGNTDIPSGGSCPATPPPEDCTAIPNPCQSPVTPRPPIWQPVPETRS